MNTKERILTIRVLEKLTADPALAAAFLETEAVSASDGGKNDAH